LELKERCGGEAAEGKSMTKAARTREELSAAILSRLDQAPEGGVVTGVVVAPVLPRKAGRPNWHAAFTTNGGAVPKVAWRIGSEIASEFDLLAE
jgi:hypothetical protein